MKVLVTGDRDWKDRALIKRHLKKFPAGTIIVEGGARGADKLARSVAEELGFEVREYPANWKEHHRAAGPIRNRKMLKEEDPVCVIAFHNDIGSSKGTMDMITISVKAGKPVLLVSYDCKEGKPWL
jgi:hypothetical protein